MSRSRMRHAVTIVAFAGALVASPAAPLHALAEEVPTPTLTVVKTKPGCCCFPNAQAAGGWGCTWGWQESRCRSVAEDLKEAKLADGRYRWNEGRCAPSASPTAAP